MLHHRKSTWQKIQEYLVVGVLWCIIPILAVIFCIVPQRWIQALLYKKVVCVRCGKTILSRRGDKDIPPELVDRPVVCCQCCTPEEEKFIEEAVERHMKQQAAERYKR